MGVFKWLRRERMTVTTRHSVSPAPATPEEQYANSTGQIGTIRTEEYKRDLAEFQARRSLGSKDKETPKKKCGRHSLPVSCTDCSADHDNTFNYEKKSAVKYKKKQNSRARSTTPEKVYEGVPNIQFLFQNQVFMPGNLYPGSSFSEPHKSKRHSRHVCRSPDMEFVVQKHIDFREDDQIDPPPDFCKNSSLPYDKENVETSRCFDDVDGTKEAGDIKASSQSSENKDDSCEEKLWEVMSELKHFDQWADEQLQARSPNLTRSDDSKSETSAYGLPVASSCNLDVVMDKTKAWNNGKWGVVPVQIKKLTNVTAEHVRKKRNTEVNILRKCRHPNIILLMGLYPDAHNNIHIICERCVDSLFGIIHVQGRILSAQTSVQYALDIANALVFLRMQGYVHTELTSMSVMVTSHDTAKLCDVGPCVKIGKKETSRRHDTYTVEPHYVNIEDTTQPNTTDCEPLLTERSSEAYLRTNAVVKHYTMYENSELYRWQAPELFTPDEEGMVYPCSKSDVYSLCLMLWECCNACIPWKNLNYEKLKEQYTLWKGGVTLPQDGTYPGCLLSLLQTGLQLERNERTDLDTLQRTLHKVKQDLDDIGYVIIPARLPKKKSTFSSSAWEITSPTDSECLSPQNIEHKVDVHKPRDSSTESEKEYSKSDSSPLYETIRKSYNEATYAIPEKCFVSDDDIIDNVDLKPALKYELLPEKECSSACSTPIAKIRARMKDISTPGTLHRSDSTEYCSILSPNHTVNFSLHDNSSKDQSGVERPTAKLSRSFTPKSYKPLHIKVPEYNLDSIRPLLKERNSEGRSSYNFDIQNYSLPTTPIARSNKLRKNAWLSGDLSASDRFSDKNNGTSFKSDNQSESFKNIHSAPETPATSIYATIQTETVSESNSPTPEKVDDTSAESVDTIRNSYTGLKRIDPPLDFPSSETDETPLERTNLWSQQVAQRANSKYKVEEDILANLHVKPLVAIHEKWIYEANKKTGRSMSLPEDNRAHIPAVKPASHCVDTLQKSLPQLYLKKPPTKAFRMLPSSPSSCPRNGVQWDQYCQARDAVAKQMRPNHCDTSRLERRDSSTETSEDQVQSKTDQATDTRSIEEFIRDLIRKEFQHLLHEISDDTSTTSTHKNEDILNKGVANIIESLNTTEEEKTLRKEPVKSFSRVKINGNNKPLLQITFSRSGENSLQVLDNCVNVTICDTNSSGKDKFNVSLEETLTEDVHVNSLKRCQAFNAIQEARSTEDLYIDDDLSTQLQENFGGKVKLIPLHGSLHEILCEKEDDCCLIKVKQENGCDTIYFRCDNSDTESRDAIDGCGRKDSRDTVVFKRSISLIEERIQRVFPKDKRPTLRPKPVEKEVKPRPKSEIFIPIKKESRLMSVSSPSLAMKDDKDEVEVNIENVMCYQDSSSEECLKCQDDDFEVLERKIEEDMASNLASMTCGCLEKISEENLSVLNDDAVDKD